MYSEIPSAQLLVLSFKAKGIKNIVISPGSRNAPLTLGFSKNPFFKCFSIVDERCAAFFALGMARQLQEPVAVVCTSGSALLNYYPAVAEAFYSEIPLIVVSADRPPYKIDVGDGQTIQQSHAFGKHIGYEANLKLDVSHSTETIKEFDESLLSHSQQEIEVYNKKEIISALQLVSSENLPVHINIPFEEPLYGQTEEPEIKVTGDIRTEDSNPANYDLEEYSNIWSTSPRKMVLIGVQQPDVLSKSVLDKLALDSTTLVFTETTSNIHDSRFFASIDSIIAPIEKSAARDELFEALRPDVLITLGGLIVSKKIKAFLRKYKPKHHWHVGKNKAYDTFFCLSSHVRTEPNTFLNNLPHWEQKEGFRLRWDEVKNHYQNRREAYLEKIGFSDFWAFNEIQGSIPDSYQVHLANSSTVRYSQLFPMNETLSVFCNRGTSGIDGSTSTAVGASIYYPEPTVLITGDLSFFYDSNGLWFDNLRSDFRIILINNGGGGIFRILPGSEQTDEFSSYFETVHSLNANNLAMMYGLDYANVSNKQDLKNELESFYISSDTPKILEVFTPRLQNDKILLDYFDFIS
ncbi:2-succinyl-5-enolpyruvyl-6-hydroxy-3-cyclohexene-1-carboxylate synthase [Flagellimonas meridianipacifica]|uniref:2-succinyl-5-enolpyruvyl-6-hydroxy-3-cyclohexene-1-carboxylate synthase n=2 Tax=Flagellimonas meridianipacifica TaxID=1080225 RepID=A0A2T0MCF5_9FLAO|nr:2-succinyl-5-enolpyruvyl-6-hydroxy-3-cyclohexene-1-carboxylate synthase [Allomuricauda pacifica]